MKSELNTNLMVNTKWMLLALAMIILSSCESLPGKRHIKERIREVENNLVPEVVIEGDSVPHFNIEERMKYHKVPGLSIALVDGGKIQWAKGYGTFSYDTVIKVDENTMFQAASISKPVAALMALKLVEEGKLALDEDVNNYLKDWKVETNKYTLEKPVTLRGLLTHTAGLTVHGFRGYVVGEEVPDIIQILNGEKPANSEAIRPDTVPGALSRYSGGGYTVMQKMLGDITGEDFPVLMEENILDKIGMTNSTYQQPLPLSLQRQASPGNRGDGSKIEGNWHIYPEMAAAGLWTTPTDLAKYMIEVQKSYQGKSNKVLSRKMIIQMLTRQTEGQGLGPGVGGAGDSLTFSHGGANEGFRCHLFGFASTGKGVVVMTNSDNGSAIIWEIMRSISNVYQWNLFKSLFRKVIQIEPDSLLRFTGTYQMNPEYVLQISLKDQKLYVHHNWEQVEYWLYPESTLLFFTLENNAEFIFEETPDKKITRFTVMGQFIFEKLKI